MEAMTVDKAIRQYYLQVILPFFLAMTSGILLGTGLVFTLPLVGFILLFGAVPIAFFLSLVLYTRWFVSVFLQVDDPGLLYKRMTSTGMITPKDSFWNKFHIKWGIEPGAYEAAWQRIEQPLQELPKRYNEIIEGSREIKGSAALFYVNLGISFLVSCGLVILWSVTSNGPFTPQIGFLYLLLGLGVVYELYLTNNSFKIKNKVIVKVTPDYLIYQGKEYPWRTVQVIELRKLANQKYVLHVGISQNGEGKPDMLKIPASGLDVPPDRLLELFEMYRKGCIDK